MNKGEIDHILARCRIKGGNAIIECYHQARKPSYLQVMEEGGANKGRKWQLSEHMTQSEIVQTAFKAYLTWVEHEARECFTYKGATIFGPHLNVDSLAVLALTTAPDIRTEPK